MTNTQAEGEAGKNKPDVFGSEYERKINTDK